MRHLHLSLSVCEVVLIQHTSTMSDCLADEYVEEIDLLLAAWGWGQGYNKSQGLRAAFDRVLLFDLEELVAAL